MPDMVYYIAWVSKYLQIHSTYLQLRKLFRCESQKYATLAVTDGSLY